MESNFYTNFKTIPRSALEGNSAKQAYSLSNIQEQIWFSQKLSDTSVWHIPALYEIQGKVNIEHLVSCYQKLIEEYDIFKCYFREQNANPKQYISKNVELSVERIDLSEQWKEGPNYTHTNKYIVEFVERPFDLSKPPLVRVGIIKRSDNQYVLLSVFHHLIADGISIANIEDKISSLYSNRVALDSYSESYRDYIVRQQSNNDIEEVKFWVERLQGSKAITKMFDKNLQSDDSDDNGDLTFAIKDIQLQGVKGYCRFHSATPFILILSILNLLLSKYIDETDVTIGCPVSGRDHECTLRAIGCYLNTVAIRTEFKEDDTFSDLLEKTKLRVAEAFDKNPPSFRKIVQSLKITRNVKRHPVFEVLLNFSKDSSARSLDIEGSMVRRVGIDNNQPKYPLTVYALESDAEISIDFNFDSRFFSRSWIEVIADHFQICLKQIISNPDVRLKDISLLNNYAEDVYSQRYLKRKLTIGEDRDVIREIIKNCKLFANNEAIRYEGVHWTYRDLLKKIGQISFELQKRGLQKTVVAVYGHAEPQIVAAIIAVMASDNIVLPIDAVSPENRVSLMFRDSAVGLVLLGSGVDIKASTTLEAIPVKEFACDKQKDRISSEICIFNRQNARAYTIYTSGTTGVAKKVIGGHDGLANFISWQKKQFEVGESDRCSLLTNLSFDVSFRDMLLPLYSGAVLCIPSAERKFEGESIFSWLRDEGITLSNMVPSIVSYWLDMKKSNLQLPNLRVIFFAGEPLYGQFVKSFRSKFDSTASIVNLYGPSETTLAKCWYVIDKTDTEKTVLPVGQVIEGSDVYISGQHGKRCGIGEIGEIVIYTPYLANNGIKRTGHFYTGDLGHLSVDKCLYFQGRKDDQIKIAGVKVNPLEVESYLSKHKDIRHATVLSKKISTSENKLLAFYATKSGNQIDLSELRLFMKQYLHPSIIPSKFIWLKQFPVKPNGKVDRKHLLDLAKDHHDDKTEVVKYVVPINSTERRVERLWNKLLLREKIGVTIDFFEAGGHSMTTLQLALEINKEFRTQCDPGFIFENNTIRKQALKLSENMDTYQCSTLKLIKEKQDTRPLYFIHPKSGQILVFTDLTQCLNINRSLYGLEAIGLYDDNPALADVKEIADRYLRDILEIQNKGPYSFVGYSFGGLIALELSHLLKDRGEKVDHVIMLDSISPSVNPVLPDNDVCAGVMHSWCKKDSFEKLKNQISHLDRENLIKYLSDYRKKHKTLSDKESSIGFERELKVFLSLGDSIKEYDHKKYTNNIILMQVEQSRELFGPYNGWENNISGTIDVIPVEGQHENMLDKNYVHNIAIHLENLIKGTYLCT